MGPPEPIHLRIFPNSKEADDAARARSSKLPIHVMQLGRDQHYLKKASGGPGIEPLYLCTDGYWRKYDLIPELPHSVASFTKAGPE